MHKKCNCYYRAVVLQQDNKISHYFSKNSIKKNLLRLQFFFSFACKQQTLGTLMGFSVCILYCESFVDGASPWWCSCILTFGKYTLLIWTRVVSLEKAVIYPAEGLGGSLRCLTDAFSVYSCELCIQMLYQPFQSSKWRKNNQLKTE